MSATVEFYRDDSDQQRWRWHAQAGNNHIVAASPKGYDTQGEALAKCKTAMRLLSAAQLTGVDTEQSAVSFFHQPSGWYWNLTDPDDELVAIGGEGYHHHTDCVDGCKIAARIMTGATTTGLDS